MWWCWGRATSFPRTARRPGYGRRHRHGGREHHRPYRLAAGVCLPPLRALPGTDPLSAGDLGIACALSALGYLAIRLQARFLPARAPEPRMPSGETGAARSLLRERGR